MTQRAEQKPGEGILSDAEFRNHLGEGSDADKIPAENTTSEVGSQPSAVPAREHRVRRILEIVTSEPPRTIRDLAGRLQLSHSYVQHMFKRQTGARLGQLIVRRRMETAARLLLQTKMCVKEIAFAVGYEHCSSFIRAFERQFRCPPQQYQQKSRSTKC